MMTAHKSLFHLTAADIMSREVETIPQNLSLQAAASLLMHEQISGAPVIDGEGRCVGVISNTDFVRWAKNGHAAETLHDTAASEFCAEWQVLDVEALPHDEVCCYMSRDVVTVPPGVRIVGLARMMLDAHIHRIIVVDPQRRPLGIVSSTDILAALASSEFLCDDE